MIPRHAKPKEHHTKKNIAIATSIAAGAVGVPLVAAAPAGATTMSAWDRVAQCESGGRWSLPFGDGGRSSGGLQFQPGSWSDALAYLRSHGISTSGYPQGPGHQAYKATKNQQIIAGEALLAVQGPGAWTCNRMVGSPLGASMFEGGPEPFPGALRGGAVATTPAPAPPPVVHPVHPVPHTHYRVVAGDWLTKIAEKEYKKSSAWKTIYDANRSRIKSPDLIYPGQVLNIPHPVTNSGDTNSGETKPGHSYVAPVNARVTQVFRNPGSGYTLGYHTGTDFTAPYGTPVRAACNGAVVASDTSPAYGTNIQIKCADGRYILYAHLSAKRVAVGATVTAGQQIGNVGSTGNSSGPHLHFEVRITPRFGAGNFLDPVAWLRAHGVTV